MSSIEAAPAARPPFSFRNRLVAVMVGDQSEMFARVLDAMRGAAVYASANADRGVAVRPTHMSVVFLLDDVVYKVKKPVNFGFVDYSTLEIRKTMCENEVRLNQRLAPSVYLGVVAIYYDPDSKQFTVEPSEVRDGMEIVEYAVKMVRLADANTLLQSVHSNAVRAEDLEPIVQTIATFHNQVAERSTEISKFGSYDLISFNVMENFSQTTEHCKGGLVAVEIYDQVKRQQQKRLEELRSLIDQRVAQNCPCDSHGDLRLEHIYRDGENIHIIDCIEFNNRFRYEDPLCDIAFLYMDLLFETCSFHLPDALLDYYFKASGICRSEDIRALALFYASYRSVVRAKVVGITALDGKNSSEIRESAKRRSHKHWMIARQLILPARSRTGLLLISGLPGSGKSTVARFILSKFPSQKCDILRTDTVRKEQKSEPIAYTNDSKADIYSRIFDRASQGLKAGQTVIVDATFNLEGQLDRFRMLAKDNGFLFAVLLCQCRDEFETRRRLESRSGDASDADWRVYDLMARSWIGPTESTEGVELIDTTGSLELTYANATKALCRLGLSDPE